MSNKKKVNKKDRGIVILLALVGGALGFHQIYLGNLSGAAIYAALSLFSGGLLAPFLSIFALARFISMDEQEFESRYNQ